MKGAPAMVSFGWSGEKNKEIKVILKDGVWTTAHYVDGQPDPFLTKVFGAHEVPTPWSSEMEREAVVKELSVRNPNSKVS